MASAWLMSFIGQRLANDSPTFLGCVTWLYGYHWGVVVPAGTMPLLCWVSSLSLQVSRSIQLLKSVQKVAWTLWGGDSCYESINHCWGPSSHSRKPESGCGLATCGTEQIRGDTNLGSNTVTMFIVSRNMYTLKMIFQYNCFPNKSYWNKYSTKFYLKTM